MCPTYSHKISILRVAPSYKIEDLQATMALNTGLGSFKDVLLDLPALGPPPGVKSNLIDPPHRRELSLGILIPCLVITVVVTLMRFYVKAFVDKKWHVEDCRSSLPCFGMVKSF